MSNACDLHVHSTFSPYDGLGTPKSVVARAVALGWDGVALTEHGHMMSAPFLYQEAKKAGIKPILGCELYVSPEETLIDGDKNMTKSKRHLTVLALSREGYENLVTWVSQSYVRPSYYDGPRISIDRMVETAKWPLHHNVVLSGCLGGELCMCLSESDDPYAAETLVGSCAALFPNFYIEIQNHLLSKFMGIGLDNYEQMNVAQASANEKLIALSRKFEIPLIVTNDSHYQDSDQRKAHLAMMARKQWRRASEAHEGEVSDSQANSFGKQYVYWTSYLRSMEKIAQSTLTTSEAEEAINSIHEIVKEANISFEPLDKFSYTVPRSGYDDPVVEVRRRTKSRLKSIVARHGQDAQRRFDYELDTMAEFAHYLCLVSDVIQMARDAGIYTWTRGSAANSLVCYCLGIHDIDPIHYKLIFERFVNPARTKLPDIDIDFEAHRRDDVAKMVKEHLAKLEPNGGVMAVCTYSTINNRAAFRLMGEAAGIPKERLDELAKLLPQMIDSGLVESDEEAYELLKDEYPDLYELVSDVFDSVGGVSQHACAYALGTDERPLSQWVPRYLIGSSNAEVTQFNMKAIEDMGFLKLDLLKLDTLTIMHNVARMLGKDLKWLDSIGMEEHGIYTLDDKTLALLCEGRTTGVHSFQGGTQRRGCIEVQPETMEDMVAIQALYRPSGTRTGYDRQFVNRKHGREDWQCINEIHAKFTEETFGFPIYQEQIMEMAFDLGMSGEEVDDLYKAIKTAKGVGRGAKELFEEFEPTFRKYADKLMPSEEADPIWAQWDAMQGYTFNRGHATSYAVLGAAKCAYIAAHHPQEFYTALLDRYPKNPRYLAGAIAEGYRFEPPDVNASGGSYSKGSTEKSIRLGLARVRGIGPVTVNALVRNQPFASIQDMVTRCGGRAIKQGEKVNTVEILRSVGALESLGISGDEDDLNDFLLMDFVPRKPKAFVGIKPKTLPRGSEKWKFTGLNRGVELTEGKAFCAKLFWIPPEAPITTKTSSSGKYDAHLLTVIDENGIPFDLKVATEKEAESKLIRLLHKKCQDSVICAEGQMQMPFLRGGNTSFTLWGIVGAEDSMPQFWPADEKMKAMVVHLAGEKRTQRRK